jgi:hypothetical protein
MSGFWLKKVLSIPAAIVLALVIAGASFAITYCVITSDNEPENLTLEELYNNAIIDSMVIEQDEIMPLVAITHDSDMVGWNDSGDRVLMITWHKYPGSYTAGTEATLKWGEVWVFTEKEMQSRYDTGNLNVEDEILRLEQLIGLPAGSGYTHFSLLWVSPDDIFRPCYDNEINDTTAELTFAENADAEYIEWFNNNIISSYFPAAYPWTRLGYTYDWSGKGTEYGLSEFIVKSGSTVIVEDTLTNEEFLEYLRTT